MKKTNLNNFIEIAEIILGSEGLEKAKEVSKEMKEYQEKSRSIKNAWDIRVEELEIEYAPVIKKYYSIESKIFKAIDITLTKHAGLKFKKDLMERNRLTYQDLKDDGTTIVSKSSYDDDAASTNLKDYLLFDTYEQTKFRSDNGCWVNPFELMGSGGDPVYVHRIYADDLTTLIMKELWK